MVLSTSSGLGFYGLAVYLNAISNEQGWNVASVSLATTVFFLVSGVAGVAVARLMQTIDVRYLMIGGAVVASAMLALLGQIEERWQLYVIYSVFAAGWAGAGLVPATTVVTRWFQQRRAVALSVASTGLSAGGIMFTPFAKRLLDSQGMAAGTPWLGLAFLLGTVPFIWFLVHPDPESMGWKPDGERTVADAVPETPGGVPYADAVHSRFFVAVTIGYVLALGAQVGAIQQLVKLVEERTDEATASFAISAVAIMSIIARLIGGRVFATMPLVPVTGTLAVLQAATMVCIAVADSRLWLVAAIFVFGATVGNILMLQPLLIAQRFGVRDYPRIFSRTQLYTTIGVAGGPLLLGWLRDVAGGYRTSYVVAGACSLAGAAVLQICGSAERSDDHVPSEVVPV